MRLEDIENEPYKLYKTQDELVDEFYYVLIFTVWLRLLSGTFESKVIIR